MCSFDGFFFFLSSGDGERAVVVRRDERCTGGGDLDRFLAVPTTMVVDNDVL